MSNTPYEDGYEDGYEQALNDVLPWLVLDIEKLLRVDPPDPRVNQGIKDALAVVRAAMREHGVDSVVSETKEAP